MLFGLAANDTLVAIAEKHRPALERQAEEHHRHHMQLQDKLDQSPVQSYSLIEKEDWSQRAEVHHLSGICGAEVDPQG